MGIASPPTRILGGSVRRGQERSVEREAAPGEVGGGGEGLRGPPRLVQGAALAEGVSSAVAVSGPYDVIALVEAASIDTLGKMIVSRIQGVKGITRTLTCPVVRI